MDAGVITFVSKLSWRAVSDHGLGVCIQEDAIVADAEQARQIVADHDDRHAKTIAQFQDQIVQTFGRDWV
jgi:hypothetical protein